MRIEHYDELSRGGHLKIAIADYYTEDVLCKMTVGLQHLHSIPAIIGWDLKDIFFLVAYVPERLKYRPVKGWQEKKIGEDFYILILVGNEGSSW